MKKIMILLIRGYQKFRFSALSANMQILSYLFHLFYTSVGKVRIF